MRYATAGCVITILCSSAVGQLPGYEATDLGRLPGFTYSTLPRGLNDAGVVVGHCGGSTGIHRAFVFTQAAGLTALPPPPGATGSSSTYAVDINNVGVVAGYSESPAHAWVYDLSSGQFTVIAFPAGFTGEVRAINNLGEVVGWMANAVELRPFYWSAATGITDPTGGLTYVDFNDINDQGLIVGSHEGAAKTWNVRNGAHTTHATLPAPYDDRTVLESVNNLGTAAGWGRWVAGSGSNTIRHALLVDDATGGMTNLGAFTEAQADAARAINDSGFVVGTSGTTASNSAAQHAWVLTPGYERALVRELVSTPGWDSFDGTFARINARGQVIVSGTRLTGLDASRRGVLLSPPLPCGTSDFDGDGDSGTDADIEAFFACLAGSCCAACHPGGSDFNGDGDSGTDADIEAFFRVLAGGVC